MLCALSVGEKFSVGGITTLLGLGMTFLVLVLLIGCVYLISLITKKIGELLEKKKSQSSNSNVEELSENPTPAEVKEDIDEETMIAIRSAVDIFVKENSDDGRAHENITILSVEEL